MPVEILAAKIFYKKYFEGKSYQEIFIKCCEYNDCEPQEILDCCKRSLKRVLPDLYDYKEKEMRKKKIEVDSFLMAFLRITK